MTDLPIDAGVPSERAPVASAVLLGRVRLAVGVGLLVLARPIGFLVLGRHRWAAPVVRALGVRDLVIGAGILFDDERQDRWLRASEAADVGDAVLCGALLRRRSGLLGAGGVVAGLGTAAVTRVMTRRAPAPRVGSTIG